MFRQAGLLEARSPRWQQWISTSLEMSLSSDQPMTGILVCRRCPEAQVDEARSKASCALEPWRPCAAELASSDRRSFIRRLLMFSNSLPCAHGRRREPSHKQPAASAKYGQQEQLNRVLLAPEKKQYSSSKDSGGTPLPETSRCISSTLSPACAFSQAACRSEFCFCACQHSQSLDAPDTMPNTAQSEHSLWGS